MPGIFKVAFNIISSEQALDKMGGKLTGRKFILDWNQNPVELEKAVFEPIGCGSADYDATVDADDAEDAIAKVRKAKVGEYVETKRAEDDVWFKKGQWVRSTTEAIQIIRVEPVAFTTV